MLFTSDWILVFAGSHRYVLSIGINGLQAIPDPPVPIDNIRSAGACIKSYSTPMAACPPVHTHELPAEHQADRADLPTNNLVSILNNRRYEYPMYSNPSYKQHDVQMKTLDESMPDPIVVAVIPRKQ